MGQIESLHEYLDTVRDRRFAWGEHDCFTFTNEAWRQMHGRAWADPAWLKAIYNGPRGRPGKIADLCALGGFPDLPAALATCGLRAVTGTPPRGALVSAYAGEGRWHVGVAFGIATGTRAAFLSSNGLVMTPVEEISNAWVNHDEV